MNILFLTTHLNSGGITSYLYILANGFISRGHNVFIVSSGGEMEDDFVNIKVKLFKLNIKTKSELDLRIYLALKDVNKIIEENDIDIIHSHTRITQVMGRLVSLMSKKPYVSTCHGYFKTRLSRRIAPCWGDGVIAISLPVRDHLVEDFNVEQQRVHLVVSGIDTDKFKPVDSSLREIRRQQFGFENKKLIGIIARLSDVKGQDILIDAISIVAKKIKGFKCLLVGEGRTYPALKKQVDSLHLNDIVEFIFKTNDISKMLSVLDVFVMPSRQEGLGISIMEAQASCLPVIGSDVGGIPTLIKDGVTGFLVAPCDKHALANAILNVLNNSEKANNIGLDAREFIKNNFSADKMVVNTLKCYENVIDKVL